MNIDKSILEEIKITPLIDTLVLEDIDDSEYFSEKFADRISNSRLGILKNKGAKAFFEGIKGEYNPSFELGSLIHQQVLQPESFEVVNEVFKPTAKAGLMADYLYKNCGLNPSDDDIKSASYIIGYYKDKLTSSRLLEFRQKAEPYWRDRYIFEQNNVQKDKERVFTDEKSFTILEGCLKTLSENNQVQELLHPEGLVKTPISGNEKAILINIKMESPNSEPKIYKFKAKLDNYTIDLEQNILTVNDLKTTSRPANMFDPKYFSYQREIAIYSWLLKLCAKKHYQIDSPTIKGNFLVVSTIPEYNTLVYPMTPQLFKSGWEEFKYLMRVVYYLNTKKSYEFN